MKYAFVIFFCITLIVPGYSKTFDALKPLPLNSSVSCGRYIYINQTPAHTTAGEVLSSYKQNSFMQGQHNTLNILTSHSQAVWLCFKTPSLPANHFYYFVIENTHFDHIDCYKVHRDSIQLMVSKGMTRPYHQENFSPEQENFQVESNTVYFIRLTSGYNTLLPVFLRDEYVNVQNVVARNTFNGFYWGVLAVMGITALLFFIRSREYLYLFYACFLFGLIILNMAIDGYLYAYIWPQHPQFNAFHNAIYSLTTIFTPLFVYLFLDIKTYQPRLRWVFFGTSLIFFLNACIGFAGFDVLCMIVIQIAGLVETVLFMVTAFITYRKGNKQAIYFIIAWSMYMGSIALVILSTSAVIEHSRYTINALQVGSIFEVVIFSLVIAGKYNQYKIQDELSQKKLISVLTEKEQYLKTQNTSLESLVLQRTEELNEKNTELMNLNKNLNGLIHDKTKELQQSIEEIDSYNKQLEQFNYITSHNLRGPLSSLKGLIHLYFSEKDLQERNQYVSKSREVVEKMDIILNDLNTILSQRKNSHSIKEEIRFEELVENILSLLNPPAAIFQYTLNIEPSLSVTGIKSFYHSIFYNLISNALKYKKAHQVLALTIEVKPYNAAFFHISIKDNGMGIDLHKYKDKIFGFYKRFHEHVDGKGLGLYITKSQVEMMGGKIEVKSEVGQGTEFIILLPVQ